MPLWVILGWNLKIILLYLKLASSNLSKYETSFGSLGPKMPHVGNFGLVFTKAVEIIEISTLEFV